MCTTATRPGAGTLPMLPGTSRGKSCHEMLNASLGPAEMAFLEPVQWLQYPSQKSGTAAHEGQQGAGSPPRMRLRCCAGKAPTGEQMVDFHSCHDELLDANEK